MLQYCNFSVYSVFNPFYAHFTNGTISNFFYKTLGSSINAHTFVVYYYTNTPMIV